MDLQSSSKLKSHVVTSLLEGYFMQFSVLRRRRKVCESRRRNKLSLVERRRDGSDEKMEEPLQQHAAAQNTANPAR